jgi:hypothetical protein
LESASVAMFIVSFPFGFAPNLGVRGRLCKEKTSIPPLSVL